MGYKLTVSVIDDFNYASEFFLPVLEKALTKAEIKGNFEFIITAPGETVCKENVSAGEKICDERTLLKFYDFCAKTVTTSYKQKEFGYGIVNTTLLPISSCTFDKLEPPADNRAYTLWNCVRAAWKPQKTVEILETATL
ncbi:MAG: hypothetical protein PHE27_05415 [Alphaproteobacteria bacterium]|nr:hypothetical protein [Alphaproteobacteria bacterium]